MADDLRDVEIQELRERLAEAEETLRAIHQGSVDALVVRGPDGPQIFTLRGAQEPYRVLVERMNEGALTVAADGMILYSNQHFADLVGCPLEQIVGKPVSSFVASQDAASIAALLNDGIKQSARRELTFLRQDGSLMPALVAVGPLVLDEVSSLMLIVTDLTAQKHSEEIAAAERFARSILEQATDVVIVCDNDGRISKASWAAERLLERLLVGQLFADAVPVEVVEPNRIDVPGAAVTPDRIRQVALQGDALYGVEAQIRTDALRDRHFLLSAGPLHDHLGKGIGCILTLTDITERKRAEEHQTMLVAELNHRVKNILAVVQSVAWQTLAANQSLSGFKEAFDGRLKAISLAHDVLTQTRWRQVELERLLGQSLAPYREPGREARVTWSGPSLLLPSKVVVPLAMVLHELSTNAAKYGAFSLDTGRLELAWRLFDDDRWIEFTWVERNGPPVPQQTRTGFGSKLISRVISYDLQGRAELDFRPEGFRCTLSFPVPTATGEIETSVADLARAVR